MSPDQILEHRKSKYLKIGREKGFMSDVSELSNLNKNDEIFNSVISSFKNSKKQQIILGVVIILILALLAYFL